ncbi:MAG: isoaspartyl peptidase/L-asparaginase [Anaerolineae bacterium]|nr:isoaspartyl peptidase/L-asparaginase [Anaerolineae bacterium]
MIVLGSTTAEPGMEAAIDLIRHGAHALDAVEAGLRLVERAPDVHSVGQDAWPNLLGEHELDASIMDGRTMEAGAVAALHGYIHPISVARKVMEELPHAFLVGEGAARFARETSAEAGDLMGDQVRAGWARWVQEHTTPQQWAEWPPAALAPWARLTADPETAHGTVTLMVRDSYGDIASGVSTSGWAWKYPGRVGDSPVIGAGNYADNRFGASSCTGFGEMTIRASSARSVLLYVKQGLALPAAVRAAVDDLHALTWRYRGGVTLYAFDCAEHHCVVSYARGTEGRCAYQFWVDGMPGHERREGTVITQQELG